MKILAILREYPYPPTTGSRIVAANILREIGRVHEVTLLTSQWGSPALAQEWGIKSYTSAAATRKSPSIASRALSYIARRTTPLAPFVDRKFKRLIDMESSRLHPDAVLLFEYWSVSLLSETLRRKALVNIEDPPSLRQERLGRLENLSLVLKIRSGFERSFYSRHEVPYLQGLAKVLVLSPEDLEDYRAATGLGNLAHCPYGVATPAVPRPREMRTPDTIAITGNMFHPPNEDGVVDFLKRVFPKVLATRSSARLRLIGASPTKRIRQLASDFSDRVEVTGRVPDIEAYLGTSMVSACPVRLRIGVQTKILEAMQAGTPVVTWGEGNSGVRGKPGVHLEVASTDTDFAAKLVSLLDGDRWTEISNAGMEFVRDNFSWENAARTLLDECARLGKPRNGKEGAVG
jgi:glycosyltransferase involved in cell wall biosynthesis